MSLNFIVFVMSILKRGHLIQIPYSSTRLTRLSFFLPIRLNLRGGHSEDGVRYTSAKGGLVE